MRRSKRNNGLPSVAGAAFVALRNQLNQIESICLVAVVVIVGGANSTKRAQRRNKWPTFSRCDKLITLRCVRNEIKLRPPPPPFQFNLSQQLLAANADKSTASALPAAQLRNYPAGRRSS